MIKILTIAMSLIVIGGLIMVGNNVLHHSSAKAGTHHVRSATTAHQATTASIVLPQPPLACATSVSLIPLTVDYEINALNCSQSGAAGHGTVLECNGILLQSATNVSMNCSTFQGLNNSSVSCAGTTNAASSPATLTLNYTCHPLQPYSGTNIYVCSGDMPGYSSKSINLNLSVTCTS